MCLPVKAKETAATTFPVKMKDDEHIHTHKEERKNEK